jgi:zinc protease
MLVFRKPLLVLTTLLVVGAHAQTAYKLTDVLPQDPAVKKGKLPNGLTYYVRKNAKPEQKVELRLVVKAGSILEDDNQQGLAHMAEHMAFNGTKNYKKNDIVSFLQSIGVGFGNDLNAYTSFDETVYMLPIPTDKPGNLEKGMQILEDWAHQVSYNTDDINDERNVILEESRLGKGAEERIFRKIYPKLFEGSKYAERLPIGVDSIIKTYDPDLIRKFYKDWYRPDLMAVIVVGDVDPLKAEQMIKQHFANLANPANERTRDYATVPPYKSNDALVVTDKEATNYSVDITYSAFPDKQSNTVGSYKDDLVRGIFTTLLNQRLREQTQRENPPFLQAYTNFSSYARNFNQFSGTALAPNAAGTTTALKALLEEIEKAKRFGFTQAEVDRAKQNMLASIQVGYNERTKTESVNYAEEYIRNFTTDEPIPGIAMEYNYYKQLVPQITLAEVNEVAKGLQKTPNYLVSLTGPDASGSAVLPTKDSLLATTAAVAGNSSIKAYEEKTVAANLLTTQPQPGKVVATKADPVMGTTTWTLSNGTTVTIKKTAFKNDEVLLGARRQGGMSQYGAKDKYNAQYAVAAVTSMGIGNFAPLDLQKVLTGKTASAHPSMGNLTDNFSGSSSVKDMETMFQLLYLYATSPRVDTALFKSFIQKNKAQTAFLGANPQITFVDTLLKTVYHNDPNTPIAIPKSYYFDSVDMGRSLEIYKEHFGDASGMNFVIVGSVDEVKLKPLVEKYIGGLPSSGKKFTYRDNGLRPAKGQINLNVNKGQAPQALILTMYTGETPYSEDLELKANAIAELLNIRIIEELREKIQGIYTGGMNASVSRIPYPNYTFTIQLPCGPEKVDTLLYAMNAEINKLKKEGPSAANLAKVKQQWLEQNKTVMKENGTWLGQLLENTFPGSNNQRFLQYGQYVNTLTAKQVQDAANLLLNGQNVVTAVLRPETVVAGKASGGNK